MWLFSLLIFFSIRLHTTTRSYSFLLVISEPLIFHSDVIHCTKNTPLCLFLFWKRHKREVKQEKKENWLRSQKMRWNPPTENPFHSVPENNEILWDPLLYSLSLFIQIILPKVRERERDSKIWDTRLTPVFGLYTLTLLLCFFLSLLSHSFPPLVLFFWFTSWFPYSLILKKRRLYTTPWITFFSSFHLDFLIFTQE